jgi:hypothetical protein
MNCGISHVTIANATAVAIVLSANDLIAPASFLAHDQQDVG